MEAAKNAVKTATSSNSQFQSGKLRPVFLIASSLTKNFFQATKFPSTTWNSLGCNQK